MYRHLELKEKNKRVIYGVKPNGDFITNLNTDLKVVELKRGDWLMTEEWVDVESGDLYYRVLNTWLAVGDYVNHLYDLYKMATNYDKAYYVKGAGDYK